MFKINEKFSFLHCCFKWENIVCVQSSGNCLFGQIYCNMQQGELPAGVLSTSSGSMHDRVGWSYRWATAQWPNLHSDAGKFTLQPHKKQINHGIRWHTFRSKETHHVLSGNVQLNLDEICTELYLLGFKMIIKNSKGQRKRWEKGGKRVFSDSVHWIQMALNWRKWSKRGLKHF